MAIYVNQVGYYPSRTKTAVFTAGDNYELVDADSGKTVLTGKLGDASVDAASGDLTRTADFGAFQTPGRYYLKSDAGEQSDPFFIAENLYHDLKQDVLRAFYYQRCGCALEEKYAGIYHHEVCHNTMATVLNQPQVKLDVHGGWHDAGDYGRYATAAAVALAHMLYAYKLCPEQWDEENNIPESGNGTPDLLNECRYELDWLLRMQREDGGVYHKVTTFRHANFILPQEDTHELFLFPVSSLATADFAAVMALASRVYAPWDVDFAERALAAAVRSASWLVQNPQFLFDHNPKGCNTGEYADECDLDERLWAAAELFVTTGEVQYERALKASLDQVGNLYDFGWVEVAGLAGIALLVDGKNQGVQELRTRFEEAFMSEARRIRKLAQECGYGAHAFSHPHNRPTVALGDKSVMPGWVSGGPNGIPCDEKAEWLIRKGTPPMKCYVDEWECYSLNEITIYWNSPVVFLSAYLEHTCKR